MSYWGKCYLTSVAEKIQYYITSYLPHTCSNPPAPPLHLYLVSATSTMSNKINKTSKQGLSQQHLQCPNIPINRLVSTTSRMTKIYTSNFKNTACLRDIYNVNTTYTLKFVTRLVSATSIMSKTYTSKFLTLLFQAIYTGVCKVHKNIRKDLLKLTSVFFGH